jgi:hypothetical protein
MVELSSLSAIDLQPAWGGSLNAGAMIRTY